MYQITSGVGITRTSDGAVIPFDPSNRDYQAYISWVASGNTADALSAPTSLQLKIYADQKAVQLLSSMRSYTASGVSLKTDALASTIGVLLALKQWGGDNPTITQNWVANDLSITPITGAQMILLAPLVGAYAQLIYGVQLAAVLNQIAAGTITTLAQIDAYGWTV